MEILVYTWQELVAAAGSVAKARTRLRDGIYRRVLRNAYVFADVADSPEVRAAALRHALPRHAVPSHWTALWVLGLDVLARDPQGQDLLDLTVPREHHVAPRPGMRWSSAEIPDEELCEVNGLLVASAARAVVDVARRDGVTEGVACGDAALRAGVVTRAQIELAIDRAGGLRGVITARAIAPHLEPRSESLMESRLRVDFVLAGGPRMPAQVDLYDERLAHRGRADLFLDGVSVEYDGRESRLEKPKFTGDRARGNDVSDLEVETRRFTGAMYYRMTPAARLEVLIRALDLASRRTRSRLRFGPDTLRPPKGQPLPTLADRRAEAA